MTQQARLEGYRFNGYRLDLHKHCLFDPNGVKVSLSSRSVATLLMFVENAGQVLSKTQMLQTVWPGAVVEENSLSQAVSSLRRALQDTSENHRCILTIPGRGYSFIAPVEACWEPSATPQPSGRGADAKPIWSRPIAFIPVALLLLLAVAVQGFRLTSDAAQPTIMVASEAAPAASTPPVQTIQNSVAVLPFTNLSPAPDNELFVLGLHDEVTNQLSKLNSLNVISRGSVLGLVNQGLSMPEISRLLGVESVMNGTLLFVGRHARVNLQLLNPVTGVTLWTGTYEADSEDLAEMFSIQSQIALHVASALEAEITNKEQAEITTIPTTSFAAYHYNLAAKEAYFKQDYLKVWQLANKAIELDPNYIDALFMVASVNNVLVAVPLPGMTSKEHSALALESADKIIALAPKRSEGYTLKAVALSSNKDWQGLASIVDTLTAMEVPPSELKFVAMLLMCLGDFQTAIDIYQANLIVEPLNIFGRGFLMTAMELNGNREGAQREYEIGEELSPVWWGDTVNIFLALGRGEPLTDIDQLIGISPHVIHLLHNVQDKEVVKNGLKDYIDNEYKAPAEIIFYAALAAHVDDHELSVQLMRLALSDAWSSLHWFWLPLFDESRRLDSFRHLLQDSGIVDYWQQRGWPEVCQPSGESFTCDWQAFPSTPFLDN